MRILPDATLGAPIGAVGIEDDISARERLGLQLDMLHSLKAHPYMNRFLEDLRQDRLKACKDLMAFGTSHDKANYLRGRIDALDKMLQYFDAAASLIEQDADLHAREEEASVDRDAYRIPVRRIPPEGL